MNGLINLSEDELDTPIYRVFNFQRLISIFNARRNTLVKPALWDDPLENFILHVATKAFADHPHTFDFSTKDRFYGQCWSLLRESDAMWRIYSPDKSGVKVQTTIRKLLASLSAASPGPGVPYIGKVHYLEDAHLKGRLQDRFWLSQEAASFDSQAASLLFKRSEFEHEEEIRLIYLNQNSEYIDNLFHYTIDPLDLFDEIQFDPRISNELFDAFNYFLSSRLQYDKPISKSALYHVPDLTL